MTTHVWLAQVIANHFEYLFNDTPEGRRKAWEVISKYASDCTISLTHDGEKLYKVFSITNHPLLQIETDDELRTKTSHTLNGLRTLKIQYFS